MLSIFQPENVVCTQKENTSVKIIDFGTAKELEPTEQVSNKLNLYLHISSGVKNYEFIPQFLRFNQYNNNIIIFIFLGLTVLSQDYQNILFLFFIYLQM